MILLDLPLVTQLISSQFPRWSGLAVTPVEKSGWDNRTFRLGATMLVRLPSAERYVAQVAKEQYWLPQLALKLPLAIPVPVGLGRPEFGYPWPWSIYGWIEGQTADRAHIADHGQFADGLAGFLKALHAIDARDGPLAGDHNFHRGGSLAVYDAETRDAIAALAADVDGQAATAVWETALQTSWQGPPVWVHGDIAVGNLLVRDGRLTAIIDFGSSGTGDPACDLVIAWTLLYASSRARFRKAIDLDECCWQRARGWALWKAVITLVQHRDSKVPQVRQPRQVLQAILEDHHGAEPAA